MSVKSVKEINEMMGRKQKTKGDEYDFVYWRHLVKFQRSSYRKIKRAMNRRDRRSWSWRKEAGDE